MSTDTSINRVQSSDSTDPLNRRKTKADKINVSQTSFFNELLNLSKFDAKIPESTAEQNRPLPAPASQDSTVPATKDDTSKPEEDSQNPQNLPSDNAAYAAQLASQPKALPAAAPSSDEQHRTAPVLKTEVTKQNGETTTSSAAPTATTTPATALDAANAEANRHTELHRTGNNQPETVLGKSPNANPESHATDLTGSKSAKANSSKVASAKENAKNQSTDKSVANNSEIAAAKSASSKVQADKHEEIKKKPTANQLEEKSKVLNDDSATESNRHNRRADRLAERTQSVHSEDNGDRSQNPNGSNDKQAIESTGPDVTVATTPLDLTSSASATLAPTISTVDPTVVASPVDVAAFPAINKGTDIPSTTLATSSRVDAVAISNSSISSSLNTTATANITPTSPAVTPSSTSDSTQQPSKASSGTSISPYQEVKLVQRVLRGLEQLGDGGGQVKLRLHPPELGSLQLSLRVEAGQMTAKMEVESTTARDALLNNLQTLKDRLADQGIKVESFDVQLSTDSSGSGTNGSSLQQQGNPSSNSAWENANSRFAQTNNNRISSNNPPDRTPAQAWSRTNGSLDLTV